MFEILLDVVARICTNGEPLTREKIEAVAAARGHTVTFDGSHDAFVARMVAESLVDERAYQAKRRALGRTP